MIALLSPRFFDVGSFRVGATIDLARLEAGFALCMAREMLKAGGTSDLTIRMGLPRGGLFKSAR
jgi:hypothetical protein